MKASKRKKINNLDTKVVLILAIFLIAILLWEFLYDSASQEAKEFYSYASNTEINRNGAFALYAIAAPVSHPDPFQWAVNEYAVENKMPRRLQWEKEINLIAKELFKENKSPITSEKFKIEIPTYKYIDCHFPSLIEYDIDENCFSPQQLLELLDSNEIALKRYINAIQFTEIDSYSGPQIGPEALNANKLFVLQMWQKRSELTDEDLQLVSRNLVFWMQNTNKNILSTIPFAISSINASYAMTLFHEINLLYPELLNIYIASKKEVVNDDDIQEWYDRMAIGEYKVLSRELCLNKKFEFDQDTCQDLFISLVKPLRTINYLYKNRPKLNKCKKFERSNNKFAVLKSLLRPGNFHGRIVAIHLLNSSYIGLCDLEENYIVRKKINDLLRLATTLKPLKLKKYEVKNFISSKSELIQIWNSDSGYSWNEETGIMSFTTEKKFGSRTYQFKIVD